MNTIRTHDVDIRRDMSSLVINIIKMYTQFSSCYNTESWCFMNIPYSALKAYLKHVYFINGSAYAGKSTVCKALAEKYHMIHCEENYQFDTFLSMTTPESHPNMNYFKTMKNWEAFVSRSKETYEAWMEGVSYEMAPFEILELISLSKNQNVIVDTNIPHDILKKIADKERVLYMVATPEIAMEEFFNRQDPDKQFLLSVIDHMKDPIAALAHYKEIIAYVNRQEKIDQFKQCGFYIIERHTFDDAIEEKIRLAEKHFKLGF